VVPAYNFFIVDFNGCEVKEMMAAQFNPDPSDLTQGTIQDLFYRQIRNMTVKPTVQDKMRSFDVQFSDAWF
jgi:hypothetical protein